MQSVFHSFQSCVFHTIVIRVHYSSKHVIVVSLTDACSCINKEVQINSQNMTGNIMLKQHQFKHSRGSRSSLGKYQQRDTSLFVGLGDLNAVDKKSIALLYMQKIMIFFVGCRIIYIIMCQIYMYLDEEIIKMLCLNRIAIIGVYKLTIAIFLFRINRQQ